MKQIHKMVHLKLIQDGPFGVRHDEKLRDLADSIRKVGLQNPPILTPSKKAKYVIVEGHRRIHAVRKILKKKRIPARIVTGSPLEIYRLGVAEFLRENFEPLEQGMIMYAWVNQLKLPIKELASAIHASDDVIRDRLKLLELHPEVKEMLSNHEISASHAELLTTIPRDEQPTLAETMHSFSRDQAATYVKEYKGLREEKAKAIGIADETDKKIQPLKVDLVTSLSEAALQRTRTLSSIHGKPDEPSQEETVRTLGNLKLLSLTLPFLHYVSTISSKCPYCQAEHEVKLASATFSTTEDQLPSMLRAIESFLEEKKAKLTATAATND